MGQKQSQEACRSGRYVLDLWGKVRLYYYDRVTTTYVIALQTCSHQYHAGGGVEH
jgi:hypothetical protein